MMVYAISIDHLTKKYNEKTAVDHVTFSIKKGELFGLLGVNGAGKTTLINMLCGLTSPTSGCASMLGYDIQINQKQVKEIIAVSPQETAIAPNLTIRENLELMAGIHGYSKTEIKEKTANIITAFSLQPYENQKGKTLSGGWQRKLSIALALISEPKILFLDEPTTYLDITYQVEILDMLTDLNKKYGTTIVMVLHDINLSARYADHIFALHKGKLVAEGTPEEVITSSLIKEIFGLNCIVIQDPISDSPSVIPIGRYHNKVEMLQEPLPIG